MSMYQWSFVSDLLVRLQDPVGFIQVIIGPRQVGKTVGVKQLVAQWDGPSIMVSADEVVTPDEAWFSFHWNRAIRQTGPTLLVIDEVQKISDWSRLLKVAYDAIRDSTDLRVVVLGSASLDIQTGLSESLAGRYELIHVPHWTYPECRDVFGWDIEMYVVFGGYPAAAALIDDPDRWQAFIRSSIIEPVISTDLLQLHSVNKPALFRQTFDLAMSYPSQEISLQKLLGQLQESGNVSTIKHYLELFNGAFLLKPLQKYTGSIVKTRQSSPKILPMSTALASAYVDVKTVREDHTVFGRLFKSVIGAALAQFDGDLYYWRVHNDEVDFVLKTVTGLYAIEVKSYRRTHLKGLQTFTQLYPDAIPVIVDMQNTDSFLSASSLADFLA